MKFFHFEEEVGG